MTNDTNTQREESSRIERYATVVGAGALILGVLALAALIGPGAVGAQPAEDPLVNETVNVTDPANESVFVDVQMAENDSLEVYAYNDTTGDEIGNVTLDGTEGELASHTFEVSNSGEHRVEIYGNESAVEEAWVTTDNSTEGTPVYGGSGDGDDGGLSVDAVEATVVAAALITVFGAAARVRS